MLDDLSHIVERDWKTLRPTPIERMLMTAPAGADLSWRY
jgi:hypothetical protein